MSKRILLMARDPGGANAIMPLVPELILKGYRVLLYGKDIALQCYQERGLAGQDISLLITDINIETWVDFLEHEKPDFIITGTSGDDFSERYLWKAARKVGIPTFAILDQWMNYGIRFSSYIPREQERYQFNKVHPYLPERILVMDDWARQGMINDGVEAERILISGQPHFDFLLSLKENITPTQIADYRCKLGSTEKEFLITYISEPLSKDYQEAVSFWGYDEHSICREILSTLSEINATEQSPIRFIVKQHPRDDQESYASLIEEFGSMNIDVLRSADTTALLMASDMVCGISSMLLLEAVLYGCPVMSVQIGLKRERPLILAQKGVLHPIKTKEELKQVLQPILLENCLPEVKWQITPGAVERVILYMEEYL